MGSMQPGNQKDFHGTRSAAGLAREPFSLPLAHDLQTIDVNGGLGRGCVFALTE